MNAIERYAQKISSRVGAMGDWVEEEYLLHPGLLSDDDCSPFAKTPPEPHTRVLVVIPLAQMGAPPIPQPWIESIVARRTIAAQLWRYGHTSEEILTKLGYTVLVRPEDKAAGKTTVLNKTSACGKSTERPDVSRGRRFGPRLDSYRYKAVH